MVENVLLNTIQKYEKHRREELMPVIEAFIKEAVELGYDFTFKTTEPNSIEIEKYRVSGKSGRLIVTPSMSKVGDVLVTEKGLADFVTKHEQRPYEFYAALCDAQRGSPNKLTGKYIPNHLR